MTNVFAGLLDTLKLEINNKAQTPVHIGEAMSCWLYVALMDEANVFMQIGLNSTADQQLIELLEESIAQCGNQSDRLREFMKKEGIPLPPTSEQKPDSEPRDIPLGAKMTDDEIANGTSIKTATAIVQCATTAAQSIRNDIGIMFVEFMHEKLLFGARMKAVMMERGWIKIPPYFTPPGLPKQ